MTKPLQLLTNYVRSQLNTFLFKKFGKTVNYLVTQKQSLRLHYGCADVRVYDVAFRIREAMMQRNEESKMLPFFIEVINSVVCFDLVHARGVYVDRCGGNTNKDVL